MGAGDPTVHQTAGPLEPTTAPWGEADVARRRPGDLSSPNPTADLAGVDERTFCTHERTASQGPQFSGKRRKDRLHGRRHRKRKPCPRRACRRRHRRRMGPGRPLRIRRQLGHQHRQRIPGRPAVLARAPGPVTVVANTPPPHTWPPRTSRSPSPSACWPPRAAVPGPSADVVSPVRRHATSSPTRLSPLDNPDVNGALPPAARRARRGRCPADARARPAATRGIRLRSTPRCPRRRPPPPRRASASGRSCRRLLAIRTSCRWTNSCRPTPRSPSALPRRSTPRCPTRRRRSTPRCPTRRARARRRQRPVRGRELGRRRERLRPRSISRRPGPCTRGDLPLDPVLPVPAPPGTARSRDGPAADAPAPLDAVDVPAPAYDAANQAVSGAAPDASGRDPAPRQPRRTAPWVDDGPDRGGRRQPQHELPQGSVAGRSEPRHQRQGSPACWELRQRGMNTPYPDQAPGPNVPLAPVDPAAAPPPAPGGAGVAVAPAAPAPAPPPRNGPPAPQAREAIRRCRPIRRNRRRRTGASTPGAAP